MCAHTQLIQKLHKKRKEIKAQQYKNNKAQRDKKTKELQELIGKKMKCQQ